MSDEAIMDIGVNYADQVSTSDDPFDDVPETGAFDEINESLDSEDSGDSGDSPDSSDESSAEDVESSIGEDEVDAPESNEEEAEDDKEGKEESGEDSEDKEADEEVEEEVDYQARMDELNQKLEDGSLEIKIDEEQSATIQELKNDFIGQREISKRFSEIDVEKKAHQADVEEVNTYINTFADHMRNGDSVGAMQYMGQFSGIAPYMVKEQLIAALTPEVIRRSSMSSVELNNEQLNAQNEYLQEQNESAGQRRESEQANMELQNSINSIRETHNIDEQTWQDTVEAVSQNLGDNEQLTPELVADTVRYSRMYTQAESVISALPDKLENEEGWIEELVNVKEKYPDFTDEDLAEVLNGALGKVKENSSGQKLAKKVESKKAPTKKKIKQKSSDSEAIDPELEDWL